MGGGLMQLVAYGAQDIYLTGNPQITFFKVVYRRHTNFSMESIQQTWDGSEGSISGQGRCSATISRNGDLVNRMYLEFDGIINANEHNPNSQVIIDIELEIGGQSIDKQTGQWMNIWSHLTELNPSAHSGSVNNGSETGTLFQNMSGMGGCITANNTSVSTKTFVPLQFWFCRNPGLSLPLIALQYHEIKVILNHDFSKCYNNTISNKLWADYIYLDTDERRRFAQVSHEYLIDQVQENILIAGQSSPLKFNHPVKELIWCKDNTSGQNASLSNGTYLLKLNGHDRFEQRDTRYFTRLQVWQYHTGCGGINASYNLNGRLNDSIAVYSFALKPEEHQPSGTCNFSRIDSAELIGSSGTDANRIYAVNYNILRIMSGMGGLAYSN